MTLRLPIVVFLTGLLAACSENTTKPEPAGEAKPTGEREYMVTTTRPGVLNIIDLVDDKIVKKCDIPDAGMPGTVIVSPDKSTAYVLAGRWSNVYGIRLDDCEVVFSALQSQGNMRVISMVSMALSPDGGELYMHQVRSLLKNDRYESLPTQLAVYDTTAGLDAPIVRTFPSPRQVTVMKTARDGSLFMGGKDIYKMNVQTGQWEVALASLNHTYEDYTPRDVLSMWPLGEIYDEMFRMYTVVKWLGEPGDMENAAFKWGYERVDLITGEVEEKEFGDLEIVLFTGLRRPGNMNQLYAVLNEMHVFDIEKQEVIARQNLEHAYYCLNFSMDGSKVYLAGTLSDISIHDADTLEKIGSIEMDGDMGAGNTYIFKRSAI